MFRHGTGQRKLTGKRCLQFFMPSYFGMKNGVEEQSVLPAITQVSLMRSINTRLKAQQFFLSKEYSLSLQFSISRFSHSGSHRKRILSLMPHHAMITRNLLILVFRSLSTFPDQQPCAGSCF